MRVSTLNICYFSVAVAFATSLSCFGYLNPKAFYATASSAISAISIISSLSLALINISCTPYKPSRRAPKGNIEKRELEDVIIWDNSRIIFRQKALLFTSLTSVCVGLAFIGLYNHDPLSFFTSIFSAFYAFSASLSLIGSFFIPINISRIYERNRDLSD